MYYVRALDSGGVPAGAPQRVCSGPNEVAGAAQCRSLSRPRDRSGIARISIEAQIAVRTLPHTPRSARHYLVLLILHPVPRLIVTISDAGTGARLDGGVEG